MPDSANMPTIPELARQLSQLSGEAITDAMIAADINDGAPIEPDGRINIFFYLAWLLKHEDDPA